VGNWGKKKKRKLNRTPFCRAESVPLERCEEIFCCVSTFVGLLQEFALVCKNIENKYEARSKSLLELKPELLAETMEKSMRFLRNSDWGRKYITECALKIL